MLFFCSNAQYILTSRKPAKEYPLIFDILQKEEEEDDM